MQIRDKEWKIVRRRLKGGKWGEAVRNEDGSGSIVLLPRKLYPDTWDEVDTLVHEVIHAALWDLDEEVVEATAIAIVDALKHTNIVQVRPAPKRSKRRKP